MKSNRKLSISEEKLIEFLIRKSSLEFDENWQEHMVVLPMDDDKMGSLHLFPKGEKDANRVFGQQISEHIFKDNDGVDVIASLNIDNTGNLLELDIWKTDFSPLIKLPDTFE